MNLFVSHAVILLESRWLNCRRGFNSLARRIVLIALVVVLVIVIGNNVVGRVYSMIPVQRAIFNNIQRITFNVQRSILESVKGIKKQVLPIKESA